MTTHEEALAKIHARFGAHDGHRALHAKGIHCVGTFTATAEAATLTKAAHMSGEPTKALVRFSNGGGDPTVPDYAPDVRGLAVSWQLPDGTRTDMLNQTLPHYAFPDQEGFLDALAISKPGPRALLRLPGFLLRYPRAAREFPEVNRILGLRLNFWAHQYFPFHSVKWVDADGGSRFVRYRWLPRVEESSLPMAEAKRLGRDYLFDALRAKLEREPIHMDLEVRIATDDDDPHSPSSKWPDDRRRVIVGTLEVTAVNDDADDSIVYDPMRLTDGIEPSDDPVLHFRPPVYSLSHARRTGG